LLAHYKVVEKLGEGGMEAGKERVIERFGANK
jgi:hypothetical protein